LAKGARTPENRSADVDAIRNAEGSEARREGMTAAIRLFIAFTSDRPRVEAPMNRIFRQVMAIAAAAFAFGAGTLPGCATMGGGGMHYVDPLVSSAQDAST